MRVLYIVPHGDDLGGIYTSTENLLQGFREAGHTATFALLKPTTAAPRERKNVSYPNSYVGAGTGQMLHPQYGWLGEYFSLGNADSLLRLIALGNEHDMIVWGAMFGLRNSLTEGNTRWLSLFSEIKKPHVCLIRDDHLPDRYPWVTELEPWVVGWACVQRSSFDSCVGLRKPRAIIYSGHEISDDEVMPYELRSRELFMMHTFKSWKRADRLVAAAPYLREADVVLAGGGIEYHYMTSETKCKPRYYCTKEIDPDANEAMLGKTLWKNALASGMRYLGQISAARRDKVLSQCQFFVDLSWRKNSTGQINRAVVEAIKQGCVPICIPRFISGRDDGDGELFKAGVHYLPVSHGGTPAELAATLNRYLVLSESRYSEMQVAGLELIKRFDRKVAAQQLINLAMGMKTGDDYSAGEADKNLLAAGHKMFHDVFGTESSQGDLLS